MKPNSQLKEIELHRLQPGMFVVKLDIPWIDSPFVKNTRLIKSKDEIAKLSKAGVKIVTIDLSKGRKPEDTNDRSEVKAKENVEPEKKPEAKTEPQKETPKSPTKQAPTALAQELEVAGAIRNQIKSAVSDLNSRLEKDLPIDSESITPLIDQTLESLERNNQALLSLTQLKRKSQKLTDHSFSCFCLSLNTAQALKLPAEETNALSIAALLHDTGWLQLPIKLMGKRSPYTPTERKLVSSHCDIGLKMLKSSDIPELSKRIIAEHHERLDGSGYPRGLKADDIHLTSKILSVVDYYDELVHQLLDKPGMLSTNALRQLYRDAEKGGFDKKIVESFISVLGVYPVTSAVELNTGERGIVEEVFPNAHLKPVVLIHYDLKRRPMNAPLRLDLRLPPPDGIDRKIESVIDPANPQHDPNRLLEPSYS